MGQLCKSRGVRYKYDNAVGHDKLQGCRLHSVKSGSVQGKGHRDVSECSRSPDVPVWIRMVPFGLFGNIYHLSQILQIQRAAHTLLRRYIRSGESGGRGTSHGQSLYRLVKSSCFTAFVNGYSCRLLCDTYGKACFAEKTSQAVFTRRGARGCRKIGRVKGRQGG